MPTLNYLAVMCREPERLKDFYCKWFAFEELSRSDGGSIYLTDGWFTMGLLKRGASDTMETNQKPGLHHVGFQIESIDEVAERLREFDPRRQIEDRPKGKDVDVIIDEADRMRGVQLGDVEGGPTREFRQRYFTRTPNNFAGDGFMNLALLQIATETNGCGIDHFGLLVRDSVGRASSPRSTRRCSSPRSSISSDTSWSTEGARAHCPRRSRSWTGRSSPRSRGSRPPRPLPDSAATNKV